MTGQAIRILATLILLACGNHSHWKLRREVVLFGVDNQECKTWKQVEQPKFESDGWVVATSNDPGKGPWPYFLIERNGRTVEHRGYLPFAKVDEVTK